MKLIQMPHKVCGMTCMVNGVEDLYEARTGTRLPDWVLFYLSGMAGFAYIKNRRAPLPRMVAWGARAPDQYAWLGEAAGFSFTQVKASGFGPALRRVRQFIDRQEPVILGAVDMYHLPYFDRFYHRFHIPYHYILMVGYDDERQEVYVYDCDRANPQTIPYADLQAAWDVKTPGLSDRFTWFAFDFSQPPADIKTIACRALQKKAAYMLTPPARMLGIPGMRKLEGELPAWPAELAPAQLEACLHSLVEFTGNPPGLPARLSGFQEAPDNHAAGRDGFAAVLDRLGQEYHQPAWCQAAPLFAEAGRQIEALTDLVVDTLLGASGELAAAARLLGEIAACEERAYQLMI